MRTVEQRDISAPRGAEYGLPCIGVCVELALIAAAKFRPPFLAMSEPLTQLGARRYILHPRIRIEGGFLDPTWPQPLDEDPPSVATCCRFVHPFHGNHAMGRCNARTRADAARALRRNAACIAFDQELL